MLAYSLLCIRRCLVNQVLILIYLCGDVGGVGDKVMSCPSRMFRVSTRVLVTVARLAKTLDCPADRDSPNTSRGFALGASDVCLVGENPTCSVPAL